MNVRFGLRPESYKLTTAGRWIFNPAAIDTFGTSLTVTAGRGDWASFQAILWCDTEYALNVGDAAWFSQKGAIPVLRLHAEADCAALTPALQIIDMHQDDDNLYKADALLTDPTLEMKRGETRAVWCEVQIPADTAPGTYTVTLSLYGAQMFDAEEKLTAATVTLTVMDCVMPTPAEHKFHLDLWQHLSNIARKHEVPLWSDAHFDVLEGYVRSLGELGQKAATLVVSEVPWSGQSCFFDERRAGNLFEYSIIPVVRRADGTFLYDYTKMQRYIDLCEKHHIDREISLYGFANIWCAPADGFHKIAPDYPDGIRLRYLDETDGCYKYMDRAADIDDYIRALEQYFIKTGQIEKVRLAADEPGDIEAYRKSLGHLKKIAPAFKCKAAINHAEFIPAFGEEVFDFVPVLGGLCGEYDKILEYKRTMEGKRFLWYVCCTPAYPNTFLNSDLTESYFIGVLTAFAGLDGFLRWNYTVWNDDPRGDIRFKSWPAGDTNFVYPAKNGAPLLTLRYKALKRGIQLYELLERLRETGDEAALAEAFAFVVREKDIRQYYKTPHALTDMCSTDYDDYAKMKTYLLEKLG